MSSGVKWGEPAQGEGVSPGAEESWDPRRDQRSPSQNRPPGETKVAPGHPLLLLVDEGHLYSDNSQLSGPALCSGAARPATVRTPAGGEAQGAVHGR